MKVNKKFQNYENNNKVDIYYKNIKKTKNFKNHLINIKNMFKFKIFVIKIILI